MFAADAVSLWIFNHSLLIFQYLELGGAKPILRSLQPIHPEYGTMQRPWRLRLRSLPVNRKLPPFRGARRTDRDCVLAKEAYLDVCLYFHRVAKKFIWAIAPLPDGLDARFC